MTSNLMSTEKGGEQTQYEAQHTTVDPPSRSSGQLGSDSDQTRGATSEEIRKTGPTADKAESMRFGQAISEEGVGGMTDKANNQGSAGAEGGFGDLSGTARDTAPGQMRREAGYDASNEQSRTIGG